MRFNPVSEVGAERVLLSILVVVVGVEEVAGDIIQLGASVEQFGYTEYFLEVIGSLSVRNLACLIMGVEHVFKDWY